MPDNRNRKRPIQVKFFVDEKELAAIKQRMMESGTDNLSAYLRTMAMEGTFPIADGKKISKQKNSQKSGLPYYDFYEEQLRRSAATFSEIVEGVGMVSPAGSVKRFKMHCILRSPLATRAPTSFCTSGYRRALLANSIYGVSKQTGFCKNRRV